MNYTEEYPYIRSIMIELLMAYKNSGREKLTERFDMKMSASMLAALREMAVQRDVDMSDVARAGIERELYSENTLCIALEPATLSALESVATTLRYRELNHLIEDIACAALKYPPQSVYNFINPELTQRAAPTTSLQAADAYARQQMAEKAEKKRSGTWQPPTPLPQSTQGDSEPDKQAKKGAA